MRASNFRITALRRHAGYSLLEVLVALAILVIGIVGVLQFFPPSLRASSEAALKGRAALLAQGKAEEIRRDTDLAGQLINSIAYLNTPTDPIPFVEDPRLVYQFYSKSLRVPDGDPSDPEFAPNVARVIVSYNKDFRPGGDVLYELRFDGGPAIQPTPTPPPCYLDQPRLLVPNSNVHFTGAPGLTIVFQWTSVPGAAEYRLEVENFDDPGWGVVTHTITGTSQSVGPPSDPDFTPGRYIWRVVATSPDCQEGISDGDLFTVD